MIFFTFLIKGITKDYYVALGLKFKGHKDFPQKIFYWSNSSFVLAPLPAVCNEFASVAKKMTRFFKVNMRKSFKLFLTKTKTLLILNLNLLNFLLPISPKISPNLIHKIERDCHVVPQGAYKLTPTHEIRKSDSFQGLNKEEMNKIEMYQHFRIPKINEKKELLARNEGILQIDIFDSLSTDKPKGA